jgi:hypothetical protein
MTKDMDTLIHEDARLIVLKSLHEQVDETLNSTVLLELVRTFGGIRKDRNWLHDELAWLKEMGAITLVTAGSVQIATLTEKGARHVLREIAISGIKRPSRPGE